MWWGSHSFTSRAMKLNAAGGPHRRTGDWSVFEPSTETMADTLTYAEATIQWRADTTASLPATVWGRVWLTVRFIGELDGLWHFLAYLREPIVPGSTARYPVAPLAADNIGSKLRVGAAFQIVTPSILLGEGTIERLTPCSRAELDEILHIEEVPRLTEEEEKALYERLEHDIRRRCQTTGDLTPRNPGRQCGTGARKDRTDRSR